MKAGPLAAPRASRQPRTLGRAARARIGRACVYLLLLAGSAVMLIPLVWLLRSSFMGLNQIFVYPPEWIPAPWLWETTPRR